MILRALFFLNNDELGKKGILGQAPNWALWLKHGEVPSD